MISTTVVGNVGRDAELQYSAKGLPFINFSVASNKKRADGEITTWVNASLYGKRAESLAKLIRKGDRIAVSGDSYLRPYEKDGQTRYSLDLDAANVDLLGVTQSGTATPVTGETSSTAEPF